MFTAMISSTVTPKMAARMIRLSTVGIAIPFCHLYIAFGVANPNISCRSFTEKPAFYLSFTIFLPVPVMSIVGTLHIILPSQNSHLICIATIVTDFFFTKTS